MNWQKMRVFISKAICHFSPLRCTIMKQRWNSNYQTKPERTPKKPTVVKFMYVAGYVDKLTIY